MTAQYSEPGVGYLTDGTDESESSVFLKSDHAQNPDTARSNENTDPSTLCPYCDLPLPSIPTPRLRNLLKCTAARSYPDPRPSNPLGLRASVSVFVDVCQRHKFESDLLPKARIKGWKEKIDWKLLRRRITGFTKRLGELGKQEGDISEE